MFNRCLRRITLKSGDRLDKLMALFIMEKMNLGEKGGGDGERRKEGRSLFLKGCNTLFRKEGEKLPCLLIQTDTFIVRYSISPLAKGNFSRAEAFLAANSLLVCSQAQLTQKGTKLGAVEPGAQN